MTAPHPVKLDLHVHAAERSGCATTYEEDQIRAAIATGLQGMAFTDHFTLVERGRLAELNRRYAPFRIYTGIEVTSDREDWLVLGLYDEALQSQGWRYTELAAFVRERGGYIVLAHPFRYASTIQVDIETTPPDGIEVRSVNTPAAREEDIRALAARLGIALLSNSDAHKSANVGRYYNELPELPDDDAHLVDALRVMVKSK